ncbi:MAG: ABC-type transport auxiliary lipoprotein family protein [bacterium]
MNRLIATLLITSSFLVFCHCGGVPPTYFYRVDYEMEAPNPHNNDIIPITLGIAPFTADHLFENDKIVYRYSPYEVQFYHYRRWVAPPKKIVAETVHKHYRASGVFKRVVNLPSTFKIDYILKGRILAFEEWDESQAWFGIVTLEFQLHNSANNEIVWEKTITEKTPAASKAPVGVVQAISESLNVVVKKSIEEIRTVLKTNNI